MNNTPVNRTRRAHYIRVFGTLLLGLMLLAATACEALATESARKNIRVNCICPGFVETNMTRGLTENPETLKQLEDRHPMGRLGQPKEIAYAALFLASDEASFITGAPLFVDGGYIAQ